LASSTFPQKIAAPTGHGAEIWSQVFFPPKSPGGYPGKFVIFANLRFSRKSDNKALLLYKANV
jgi:hypothetical protein